MKCESQRGQGYDGMCIDCGQPIGASGCDGGSWVHISTAPDRVISTKWAWGRVIEQRLANGVLIKYKGCGIPMDAYLDALRTRD
jgi:hypothetical protein